MHERLLHAPHPLVRYVLFVAPLIIHRRNFVFQYGIDGASVDLVLVLRIRLAIADRPPAGELVGLVKPAIENTQVEDAVDPGFHAAGTARFLAAARSIKPEIYSLDQFAADPQTVILDEYNMAGELRIARELHDFANQHLAGMIFGVSFSGNEDLHGPVRTR